LKLQDEKWYVGVTARTPEARFQEHVRGYKAAKWTEKYKPIAIIYEEDLGWIEKETVDELELAKTKELMKIYGWQNVRGGKLAALEYKKRLGILWRKNDDDMPTTADWDIIKWLSLLSLIMILATIAYFYEKVVN